MSLEINNQALFTEADKKELEILLGLSIDRYLKFVASQSDPNFLFLKSFSFTEEIVNEIILKLYGHKDTGSFGRKLKKIKQFTKDKDFKKSYDLLLTIINQRNDIAHNLEYKIEEDVEFWNLLLKKYPKNKNKKELLARLFSDVIHGFLYLNTGLRIMPNFIVYKK